MTGNERNTLIIVTAKRTLVAFIFGFVLSSAFALAIAVRFEPLMKLERESIDFSLRIANAVFRQSNDRVALPDGASPILMIDIDAEACAELADANRCNFDRLVQPEVVRAVVNTIKAANPDVAVMDMLVAPEASEALKQALEEDGPPILTVMELSELETGRNEVSSGYLLNKSLCNKTRCSRLEYLPSHALVQDGKSRFFPRSQNIEVLEDLSSSAAAGQEFPSLPYRAAELSDPDGVWQNDLQNPQIGYTIPSFVFQGAGEPISEDRRASLRRSFCDRDGKSGACRNIVHYRLSNILADNKGAVEFEEPAPGTVLVIGSSAVSGGDIHNTPLGPMGGMEVVANAIRSFEVAAPEQVPSAFEAFLTKIEAVFKALLIIAAAEVFLAYLSLKRGLASRSGRYTVADGAFWDRWSGPVLLVMALAFLGETALTFWEVISQLNSDIGRAGAVDVVWPIVGVTLSALIGFAGEILAKLEWLVDRLFVLARVGPTAA